MPVKSPSRLKKETTLQSLSVTGHLDETLNPPHGIIGQGHTKTLSVMGGHSLPSEETLPSPSSSSSQIQHRAQVTLERANSRWLFFQWVFFNTFHSPSKENKVGFCSWVGWAVFSFFLTLPWSDHVHYFLHLTTTIISGMRDASIVE